MDKQRLQKDAENTALEFDDKTLKILRDAFEDRALWLYFLYEEMKRSFGEVRAREISKLAIRKYGTLKGDRAVKAGLKTPKDWITAHNTGGNHCIFSSSTAVNGTIGEQKFFYCPLVEAWKKVGCTKEEIKDLCDIAMEGDYGMADAMGIKMEIPKRIATGNDCCQFILKESKNQGKSI